MIIGKHILVMLWNRKNQTNKPLAITACKRHSLAAGATHGNIAYTQIVSSN